MAQSSNPGQSRSDASGKAQQDVEPVQPVSNQEFLPFFLSTRRNYSNLSLVSVLQAGLVAFGASALASSGLFRISADTYVFTSAAAWTIVFGLGLWATLRSSARLNATTALANALLDANRECLKLLDVNGQIVRISEHGAKLMEASGAEQLAGTDWHGLWGGNDAMAARTAFDAATKGERTTFRGNASTTKGTPKAWQSRLIPISNARGKVDGILCASLDVTHEQELATALHAKQALMAEMEAHVGLCFYSYSADFTGFHHITEGCASVFGLEVASFRESPVAWMGLVLPEDLPGLISAMRRVSESKTSEKALYRFRRPDGEVRWIQSTGSPILDNAGNVARIVGISEDVTEEQSRLAELDRLAFTDALTGLSNRAALMQRLEDFCGKKSPFALMFIDLDRFKVLNDTLGHTAADRLLRTLGKAIRASLPEEAFLARLGGDEFAVLIHGTEDRTALAGIARCILDTLAKAEKTRRAGALTASIGISLFPENGDDRETLLTTADLAMYAAKKTGRNGYRFADKDAVERIGDFELERDLPAALAKKQFQLHYQGIHEPQTLEIRGVEALIRWRHPKRGLIPPCVFIPILEESGFITEVGAWAMDDALRQLSVWRQAGARSLGVSVNVSAGQLRDSAIVDLVDKALRRHALPPSTLQLELTESGLMADPCLAQRTLLALKKLGVRIAIDDFGTGHSSLRYLADFAPDTVKIDRSFVARLQHDPATHGIVSGIIEMTHVLGAQVTAEGVENATQLALLKDARCDLVQGYLLSRPVAPEDMRGLRTPGTLTLGR
jgi:diguanylate cyclase (GGDEF)-like protein